MADIPSVKELEEKKQQLKESLAQYEESKKLSKEIADLKGQVVDAQNGIVNNLNYGGKIGAVDRIGRVLTAFTTTNATYVASKAAMTGKYDPLQIAAIQAKQYGEDILANFKSAATGREYRKTQSKEGTDLLVDIFGKKKGATTTAQGISYDIMLGDPSSLMTKGLGTTLKVVNELSGASAAVGSLLSRVPVIKKGMDGVARSFNLFYDLDKSTLPPDKIAQFKDGFRMMASTGDDSLLRALGKQMPMTPGKRTNQVWQAMTNLGWGNGPGTLKDVTFPKEMASILDEAFGQQESYTGVSKALSWTNTKIKSLLAWNPKWQTRNVTDALVKNSAEGVDVMDYLRGIYARVTGGVDAQMGVKYRNSGGHGYVDWQDLVDAGLTGSTGPMDTAKNSIIGKITNFFETTFARVPLAMKKLRTGEVKSVMEAGKAVEDVHYNYTRAYLTGFEKRVNDLVLPYYKYEKGQMQYWPDALIRKQRTFGGLYHGTENTEPQLYQDNPQLKPSFLDYFGFGKFGNVGTSLEDFAKTITLVDQNLTSKISMLPKAMVEGATDYSFFAQQSISGNRNGSRYANAGPILKDIVGYNEQTGETDNTKLKWIIESAFGTVLSPYLDARDPKKPWSQVLFSGREYDYSLDQLQRMKSMEGTSDQGTGGIVGKLLTSLSNLTAVFNGGIGATNATAGNANLPSGSPKPVPVTIVKNPNTIAALDAADDRMDAQKKLQWKNTRYGVGSGVDPDFAYRNAKQQFGNTEQQRVSELTAEYQTWEDVYKNMMEVGATSGEMFFKGFNGMIETGIAKGRLKGVPKEVLDIWKQSEEAIYELERPRGKDEFFFTPEEMDNVKSLGTSRRGQALTRAQETRAQFSSKTSTMYADLADKDIASDVIKTLKFQTEAVQRAVAMSIGDIRDLGQARLDALRAVAENNLEKLTQKTDTAIVKSMETWVSSMEDSVEKVDLLRQIDLEKFAASEDARLILKNRGEEAYQYALMGINKKYDDLKAKQVAKDAKQINDVLTATMKDQVSQTAAALKSIFDRGGIGIDEYYDRLIQDQLKMARETGVSTVREFLAGIKTTKMQTATIDVQRPSLDMLTGPTQKSKWDVSIKDPTKKLVNGEIAEFTRILRENLEKNLPTDEGIQKAFADSHIPQGLEIRVKSIGDGIKQIASGISESMQVLVAVANEESAKMATELQTLLAKLDPNASKEDQISALSAVRDYMAKILEAGQADLNISGEALKKINELIKNTGITITGLIDETKAERTKLTAAINEINKENQRIATTFFKNQATPRSFGALLGNLTVKKRADYPKDLPPVPAGFNATDEDFKQNAKDLQIEIAKRLSDMVQKLKIASIDAFKDMPLWGEVYGMSAEEYKKLFKEALEKSKTEEAQAKAAAEQAKSSAEATQEVGGAKATASAVVNITMPSSTPPGGPGETPESPDWSKMSGEQPSDTNWMNLSAEQPSLGGIEGSTVAADLQTEEDLIAASNDRIVALNQQKLDALTTANETYKATEMTWSDFLREYEAGNWEKKLADATKYSGMLADAAGMIYEQSGRQSKAAFYVMKAARVAEATITGVTSIIEAYKAGMETGGPAAPYLAAAYAGIAAAFVGAQIGLIVSQTIAGPEGKAEGGPIEGGSGTKDDVPIMAMGGEYVIQKSAVNKYGKGMLDAINQSMFDAGNVSFAIPPVPDTSTQRSFASGGAVPQIDVPEQKTSGGQPITIVNMLDARELDAYLASPTGQSAVLNVLSSRGDMVRRILR